jgi:hypothetical protein
VTHFLFYGGFMFNLVLHFLLLLTCTTTMVGISSPAHSVDAVSELKFNEFFKMPIGSRGLEPTEKLLSLKDKQVRIIGYMAQEDDPEPGLFMMASQAVNVGEKADGMADDLPAATLFVHMPTQDANHILAYRPGPWALTGKLEVGNKEEASGRVSFVRLIMDKNNIDIETENTKGKNSITTSRSK